MDNNGNSSCQNTHIRNDQSVYPYQPQPNRLCINVRNVLNKSFFSKRYALAVLAVIGIINMRMQNELIVHTLYNPYYNPKVILYLHTNLVFYVTTISYLTGGILAYVYKAHKLSIILSSTLYILLIVIHDIDNTLLNNKIITWPILFCYEFVKGAIFPASISIWKHLAPQNERPILATIVTLHQFFNFLQYKLMHLVFLYKIRNRILGLFWNVLWTYLVHSNLLRLQYNFNSITNTIMMLFNIPWKKMLTSISVYAIILAYMGGSLAIYNSYEIQISSSLVFYDTKERLLVGASLIAFGVIIANYFCFQRDVISTTLLRKTLTCSGFVIYNVLLILYACDYIKDTEYMTIVMKLSLYASTFGYTVNHLDITPKYASILLGITMTINSIFMKTIIGIKWTIISTIDYELINRTKWTTFSTIYNETTNETQGITYSIIDYKPTYKRQFPIISVIVIFLSTLFYGIFASGETQPWAEEH